MYEDRHDAVRGLLVLLKFRSAIASYLESSMTSPECITLLIKYLKAIRVRINYARFISSLDTMDLLHFLQREADI